MTVNRLKSPRLSCGLALSLLACGNSFAAQSAPNPAPIAPACEIGSYRLSNGDTLDIGRSDEGKLRWRLPNGETGMLSRGEGGLWISTVGWSSRRDGRNVSFSDCAAGTIRFAGWTGKRIPLIEVETRFQGSGVSLAGRLTLPPGDERIPIVVLIHGSERSSALTDYSLQRQFAAAGIGVFAYDKRGTGKSGGRYTQNYLSLAVDAVHAAREARRLAGKRAGRVGYQGGSQGGWVAPLAAKIEPVDFVIVSFGLAVSALEEDREAIGYDVQRAGLGPDVLAKAMEIADATAAIVGSNFTEGYERLEAVKGQYGKEPWFKLIQGNFSGYLLETPAERIREQGPRLLEGLAADYDPLPVLEGLDVPQLWILAEQDRAAPPRETLRRLARLQSQGRPIRTAVFPNTDHGIYEFETDANGERVDIRQPDGYLRLMKDFMTSGVIGERYGSALISSTGK